MPISLEDNRRRLNLEVDLLTGSFQRHVVQPSRYRLDRISRQEGLISSLWQAWGNFCREVIVHSAIGAITSNGVVTVSAFAARREAEITYCAREFAQGKVVGQVKALSSMRQEPTWGDVSKAALIIGGLNSSNSANLSAGLSGTVAIRDLQICRNACAHINFDTVRDVRDCRIRYSSSAFRHPSDMALWVDPSSNDFLWMLWCEDLKLSAQVAVQ